MREKFKRIVKFRAAYDKRNPDPTKSCGVHCVDMWMVLKGRKGAVSFTVFTGWYLPKTKEWWKSKGCLPPEVVPSGADISYHSKKPLRDFQNPKMPSQENCEWCDGKPCWADGSGLQAVELFNKFVEEGEEVVWKILEEWYHSEFDTQIVADKGELLGEKTE